MSNKLSLLVNFVGVDKMSKSLRSIVGLGRKGSTSLNELRGEGRKLESQLRRVRQEIERGSGNLTELVDRERDLERQIERTNAALGERRRLNAIEGDRRAMVARGEDLRQRGQENMVQGAALLAPLVLATKQAAEFSSGMVDIQQKAELTNAQTDRLANTIVAMARAARLMPEEMRSGLDVLLARGMDLDAATAAIGPAGRLATAYKVELPDAAAAAYASINNLKIASGQTAQIFDAMAAAGNAGGFEIADMARHFPALTAQMQALGEKGVPAVADLSAALQVAMNTAGDADEAGNNIKNLLSKINAPGTIAAFRKNFGVDLPAAMKKLEDQGYSSLEAIALITKQATGGDMKKLGFAFEDMQARQGIMALIQNMDEYRRIRAAAMKSGGTVDAAFSQRAARDATVQWKAFMSTASSLAIVLGTTLLPVATQVLGMISRLATRVAQWAERNPEAAATITKLVAGLAVFKIGLGAAQFAIGGLLGPLANVIAFARRTGIAVTAFNALRTAVLFLGKGFLRAGAMMLMNPIVLIITAIVAAIALAGYLIYTHWDTIKGAFDTGVAAVKSAIEGLPDWLKNLGKMALQGLLMAINPMALAGRLLDVARNGVAAFKNYFGIKSPSRLMMEMGSHVTHGLARGLDGGAQRPVRAMGAMAGRVAAAGAIALSTVAAPAQSYSSGGSDRSLTINIYQQPGQDARALAREVRRELDRMDAQRARGSYQDIG